MCLAMDGLNDSFCEHDLWVRRAESRVLPPVFVGDPRPDEDPLALD